MMHICLWCLCLLSDAVLLSVAAGCVGCSILQPGGAPAHNTGKLGNSYQLKFKTKFGSDS
jgi:hypothetical protein